MRRETMARASTTSASRRRRRDADVVDPRAVVSRRNYSFLPATGNRCNAVVPRRFSVAPEDFYFPCLGTDQIARGLDSCGRVLSHVSAPIGVRKRELERHVRRFPHGEVLVLVLVRLPWELARPRPACQAGGAEITRLRRYYKAAHWTRGWADREKAARFVAEVTAFGRAEEAYTRDFHAAARKIWGPRGF